AKTVDGHTTRFFWQGDQLVAESSPTHYRSYLYEPGSFRPLALLDGKGPKKACPFYYQLDHLGTPQELTDYGGDIVWSAKYTAYGKLSQLNHGGGEQLEQPLRFQGQYFDTESGLHYNRHRYYHPDTGRYLTPDPVKLAGGLNAYQYTRNPTGWVDPLGLSGNCPGGNGCKKSGDGEKDPADKARVDEGTPALPFPQEVDWTPHGYKHMPSKNMSWKETINSTKSGPAKYKHGISVESLEREAYKSGSPSTNGKPWKIKEYDTDIGASEGKLSRWIRIELSARTIHGHPISENEFRKLKK
ncbi:RHS repeat domain-containing protein, partial [Pseudomonas sp. G(2018)]|uniref:RHS repeat domain-containing protein n=1 Tax=Pseudomonas sp. G(2018) TaxID=2502242 RepID=UPI0015A92335